MDKAHEQKIMKYSDIAVEAIPQGWKAQLLPVEVRLQRLCGHIDHQAAETDVSLRTSAPTSHQVAVRGLGLGLATGWGSKERTPTGLQDEYHGAGRVKMWGEPRTPDVTDEPSGGVVGSSSTHQ